MPMAPTTELVILMVCIAMLPLGGAYLLYSKLPSETVVSGPFKGLQMRLTGAFAGYFAFALLLMAFTTGYRKLQADYEPVMVQGRLEQAPGSSGAGYTNVEFTISPPVLDIAADGRFWVVVPVARTGSQKPHILISRPGYHPRTIHLDPDPVLDDPLPLATSFFGRTITITRPLSLAPEEAPYEGGPGAIAVGPSDPEQPPR